MAAYLNTFLFLHAGISSIVMNFWTCVNEVSQDKTVGWQPISLLWSFRSLTFHVFPFTTEEYSRRMLKMAVQRGRSERRGGGVPSGVR